MEKPLFFFTETFKSGTPLSGSYRFNSWRLTYRYDLIRSDRWTVGVGLTAKIRDAEIFISGGGKSSSKTDIGLVPLLSLYIRWQFSPRFSLILDGDALASPGGQGRAEDVLLALMARISDNLSFKIGYRILEGGADVEEVYNFALLHFASAGIIFHF